MKRDQVSLQDVLVGGEPARLFPVLAEKSTEGRTTSVFLACLALVPALSRVLLEPLGQRVGNRASVRTFTEVRLANPVEEGQPNRPDGLIAISKGRRIWTALIEAKVGRGKKLNADQVKSYMKLAAENEAKAVITVSNDFAAVPSHHPLQKQIGRLPTTKVSLFHWSWASVLTHAKLLLAQGVDDLEQRTVLAEFVKYLEHPSSGVMRFNNMGEEWSNIVTSVTAGARPRKDQVEDTVASWHQETRDLALKLTDEVNRYVRVHLSQSHRVDSSKRIADDAAFFSDAAQLRASFDVPDAASRITVVADVGRRSIEVSMSLNAPTDKRSTLARVNWLLRQLAKSDSENLHIAAAWPRRANKTQERLVDVLNDPRCLQHEDGSLAPVGFEVKAVWNLGRRFSGKKTFVDELEDAVETFYKQVGQRLKRWQPAAPRMKETVPSDPSPPRTPAPVERPEDVKEDTERTDDAGDVPTSNTDQST